MKTCNYCGAEMTDSEVICKKCHLPNTGESREVIEMKVSLGIYKYYRLAEADLKRILALERAKKLPNEVRLANGVYCVAWPNKDTKGKEDEYLKFRNATNLEQCENHLRTIRNCVIFFVILTVIGLVCELVLGSIAINNIQKELHTYGRSSFAAVITDCAPPYDDSF